MSDISSGGSRLASAEGRIFRPSLNECEGSKVCPKQRRETDEIFLGDSLDLSNQGKGEMGDAMSLYQGAKWMGRPSHYLSHNLSTLFFSIGQKSGYGIVLNGGQHKQAVDLARVCCLITRDPCMARDPEKPYIKV